MSIRTKQGAKPMKKIGAVFLLFLITVLIGTTCKGITDVNTQPLEDHVIAYKQAEIKEAF